MVKKTIYLQKLRKISLMSNLPIQLEHTLVKLQLSYLVHIVRKHDVCLKKTQE